MAFRLEAMVVRRAKSQDDSADLDRVRQLLASTREDVRRSLWNLRAHALEGQTLPMAIQSAAMRLAGANELSICVETEGPQCSLPDLIAGNLLLLVQEAVTNVVKHARAHTVVIRVLYAEEAITISIEDDGEGFEPAGSDGPREGHFGLQGMRERAKRLGGVVEITSKPGCGSLVTVKAPLRMAGAV